MNKLTEARRIELWQDVVSDPNWGGNKSAQYMADNYDDDNLQDCLSLCGQNIEDPDYNDGR